MKRKEALLEVPSNLGMVHATSNFSFDSILSLHSASQHWTWSRHNKKSCRILPVLWLFINLGFEILIRLPDMHGHYELLRSTSTESRDLKAGEVNLKRLGANLRFSSDSVAGPSLWARTSFGGDFILIAEFSEIEGPKPVVSLPEIQLIRFKPPSFENTKLFLVY